MAGEYDINLSNGEVLATLYPLETNGPDNRSTPRQIKRTKPTFAVVQVPAIAPNGVFQFAGDITEYFPPGLIFDIIDSTTNDGQYTVVSATYLPGTDETNVEVSGTIPSATIDGSAVINAFVLSGDITQRFIPGFEFDVQESGGFYGSPPTYEGNDGTYTVNAFGAYLAFGMTVIPVLPYGSPPGPIANAVLPLGQIQYTVPVTVGSPQELNTTLKLPGKGVMNYGEYIIENLVRMTEHFAADDEPEANANIGTDPAATPLVGQMWYKTLAGQEGFKYYDGSSWTSNFDFDNGVLIFRDPYNDAAPGFPTYNTDIMVTADPAELVTYGYGGTPTDGDDAGLLVWTKDNPNAGDPIFRVMSSGLSERLRVEHDGYTRTSNLLEVQGTGDSHIYDNLSIGYNGTPPTLARDLDVAGESEFNGDVYVTNASDIIFDNGQGLESVAGALIKTGPGGKTWQVFGVDNTASTFVVNDSTGIVFNVDESATPQAVSVSNDYDFYVDTDTLYVDVSTDRVGINQSAPSEALDVVGNTELNGNLYVDTNVLYVDAASNEVGINKNPAYPLDVTGNTRIEGRVGINQVPPVTNVPAGTDIWLAVTGDIQANSQFLASSGVVAEPAYSFTADPQTGLYLNAVDSLHLVTNGQLRFDVTNNYVSSREVHSFIAGDAVAPSLTLNVDPNTGIFFENPDVIGFSTGGTERLRIDAAGAIRVPGGASPDYAYESLVVDDDVIPNKKYVDDTIGSISWREPVLVHDDTSSSLPSGSPFEADGVPITTGDRVLFTNLGGSPSLNDIYEWDGATWVQVIDPNDRTVGDAIYIQEGTHAGKVYAWHTEGEWRQISGAGGGAVFVYEGQTASASQTLFTLSNISYQPGADRLMVFVDGVKYISGVGYTENTSTTVTLAPPVPFVGGEQVEFYALADVTAAANLAHEVVVSTGASVVTFALTYVPGANNLLVYLNGQKAVVGVDYTETSANSITWIGTPLVSGDQLELYSGIPVLAGTKLGDISDVDAAALTPSHGDILVYNTVSGLWEPTPHISEDGVAFDELVANGAGTQQVFNTVNVSTVAKTGTTAYQQVFVNGVLQKEGALFSYTVTGANQITFNAPVVANADVTIYQL